MKRLILIFSLLSTIFPLNSLADNEKPLDAINSVKDVCKDGEAESSACLEASYIQGISFKEQKNWSEAAVLLQKASRYQPLADYALFHLGDSYTNAGNYESAYSSFQSVVSNYPESRWRESASFKAASALFQMNKNSEALSAFDAFIRENPRSSLIPAVVTNMAQAYEKAGKTEDAYNAYKRIWLNYPLSSESRSAMTRMEELASKSSSRSLHAPTIDERYRRTGTIFSAGLHNNVITELSSILKDLEKEKEKNAKPQWLQSARFRLAEAYFNTKADEKAEPILKKLVQEFATDEYLFLYGKILQRSGKRGEAYAVYEKIVKGNPKSDFAAKALYRAADMADADGDGSKARELYHKLSTSFPQHSLADDAVWREGWINYLDKNYKESAAILQKLLSEYPDSEFTDTASYWLARIGEKTGNREDAAARYSDIASKFPISYYSVLSKGRLYAMSSEIPLLKETRAVSYSLPEKHPTTDKTFHFHLNKGKLLLKLGFNRDAAVELAMAEARCGDSDSLLEIARLLTRAGDYYRPQRIMHTNAQEFLKEDKGQLNPDVWSFAFPLGFSDYVRLNAEKNSLNRYLIHAIIREESTYRPEVVSRAGAIGLMQLMPATGHKMSLEQGFKGYSSQTLYMPEANIRMGSFYLRKLIDEHKGNLPLAVASYNAGSNAVATWIAKYGTEDMDEFIEKIPYFETRNYVKKVLRSYRIYERLYSDSKM